MPFSDEPDREHRRKPEAADSDPNQHASKPRQRRSDSHDVGNALRTVYQHAVEEDIPPEMLDLLGKLG